MTSLSPNPGDKLPVRVRPQSAAEVLRPSAAELSAMVERIGGEQDHFLVVERVPHVQRAFIQTYREAGESFSVQYRDGGREQYEVEVADAADVAWVLTAWAREEPEWLSGVDWGLSYEHPEVEVTPLSPTAERTATRLANRYLNEGYLAFETMAQTISECSDQDDPVTIEQAETLLEPLWARRVAEQRSWPETTDVDRIEAAFERLRATGVTARSHFACCQNCGTTEIGGEAAETDHGYVFFHYQDTETAVDGTLHLAYGSYSEEEDGVAVGHEVVEALSQQGLATEWDGCVKQRVKVVRLEWKKRLE